MHSIDMWLIGMLIYGVVFFVVLSAWKLLRSILGYATTPSSLCEVSCFGVYSWVVIAGLTVLGILDARIQTIGGMPLILGWVIAQISAGESSSYLIKHRQYPPPNLHLQPGGVLIGLVFWQMAFYLIPYIPGVLPLTHLSLPKVTTFIATAWGGQGWFLYQAFKTIRSPEMVGGV